MSKLAIPLSPAHPPFPVRGTQARCIVRAGPVQSNSRPGWRMALLSLGECKWRMVRRVLKKKRFRYDDTRNQTRHDPSQFDWLVENGLFVEVGEGLSEVTDKGKAAADLGLYEYEPPA